MIRRTTGDIFDCGAENLEATLPALVETSSLRSIR